MKNQIILLSLAISGLLITAHSVSATTNEKDTNISRTITDLVKLDANHQNLVEKAIDRALVVKKINAANNHLTDNQSQKIAKSVRGRIPKTKKFDASLEHIIKKESEDSTVNNDGILEGGGSRTRRKYTVPGWILQPQTPSVGQIRREKTIKSNHQK
jgi:hypothetical protein